MSIFRHGDGLFWPSLFSVNNDRNKKQILHQIRQNKIEYDRKLLATRMLQCSDPHLMTFKTPDDCMQIACEHVALKFMLFDSDFAADLLDEQDLEKAKEVYTRKQFNSKILQKLLRDFLALLDELHCGSYQSITNNLFTIPLIDEFLKVQDEEIQRAYGALKQIIEKVAGGVKSDCYKIANNCYNTFHNTLDEELNENIIKSNGYDFNDANFGKVSTKTSTLFCNCDHKEINKILQLALVNDESFWSKHDSFSVIVFINEIKELNDVRHAEKVLSFVFENLKKMPNMDVIIKHSLPIYASQYDKLLENLEDQAFRFAFKRLEQYCDITKIRSIPLCAPMSKADASLFEIGKNLWSRFISVYNYPNDHEAVNKYISDEINRFITEGARSFDDIAIILDSAPFRYCEDHEDRRFFTAYCPDCFSYENIWNRVYLKAYAVTLLSDDEQTQFSFLQRIFVDLIKTIERTINICTTYQLDTTTREKHYLKLKDALKSRDIDPNDEHKNNYIIALLDRDTALIEEAERFPMLEQAGDAIYGLAVAELLFYNPDNLFYPEDNYDPSGKNIAERFEKFTRAEAQILISKKNKLDKLYLQVGLPAKYIEYDTLYFNYENSDDEYLQALNQEKYLADSLEMIIGAIYFDKGLYTALNFTKQLLKDTYPKHFSKEIYGDEMEENYEKYDWEYWPRILPGLYSDMCDAHRVLWNALNKVILVATVGTDDANKRRYITNHSSASPSIYGVEHFSGISRPFYLYLNTDINYVLKKYSKNILNDYNKNKL